MILHFVIAFLFSAADAQFFNSPKTHLSDSLKVKCDALPYRSSYVVYGCYFAVMEKIKYTKAAEQCSEILAGSKVVSKVPSPIFDAMMIRKSDFHIGSDSEGQKYIICAYDNDYKCDAGQSLTSGRCIFRAAKKMNFIDAEKYCGDQGMEIPAPANNYDNKIVREALVKDPAWVQKSIVKANGLKWKQASDYTKWSTCDRPAEHNPRLYAGSQNDLWSCSNDTATVIDKTGYWSNGGTNYLMEVLCSSNAKNSFTNGDEPCKSYHEIDTRSGKQRQGNLQPPTTVPMTRKHCYNPVTTKTRYEVIGQTTVETQRGCEVLCDDRPKCSGFSFKEDGFTSSCVLLSTATNQKCGAPTMILAKTNTDCVARTNLTAEFGTDPCVDEMFPIVQDLGKYQICPLELWPRPNASFNIIRAVHANGSRITLDNEHANWLEKSGDMWAYHYTWRGKHYIVPIVAAACALAEGVKCPCAPLKYLPVPGYNTVPAKPEVINPCEGDYNLNWMLYKIDEWSWLDKKDTGIGMVSCKAGMWIMHGAFWNGYGTSLGVSALSCTI